MSGMIKLKKLKSEKILHKSLKFNGQDQMY